MPDLTDSDRRIVEQPRPQERSRSVEHDTKSTTKLSPRQERILDTVAEHPGFRADDIAAVLNFQPASVKRALRGLEILELVISTADSFGISHYRTAQQEIS